MCYNIIPKVDGFVNTFFAFQEKIVFFFILRFDILSYRVPNAPHSGALDLRKQRQMHFETAQEQDKHSKAKRLAFDNIRLHFCEYWRVYVDIDIRKLDAFYIDAIVF